VSTYIHAVFFRCRGETSADEINALIRDAVELLGGIPTVRDVRCGRRDAGAVRDVNDTQFHVGLVVTFRDRSDCEAYLEHPAHLAFVQKHRPRWSEVRVCDFAAN
jgi:hypothetical protein